MAQLTRQNAGSGNPNWWDNDELFMPKFEEPVCKLILKGSY